MYKIDIYIGLCSPPMILHFSENVGIVLGNVLLPILSVQILENVKENLTREIIIAFNTFVHCFFVVRTVVGLHGIIYFTLSYHNNA